MVFRILFLVSVLRLVWVSLNLLAAVVMVVRCRWVGSFVWVEAISRYSFGLLLCLIWLCNRRSRETLK